MRRFIALGLVLALTMTVLPAGAAVSPAAPPAASGSNVIVVYSDQQMSAADFGALSALGVAPSDVEVRRPEIALVEVPLGKTALGFAKELVAQPGIAAAAPAGRVQALETVPPNDSKYSLQRKTLGPNASYPHSIDVEPVWDAVFNGDTFALEPDRAGVTVAVVDSGVSASAMEDPGMIVPAWNYVSNNTNTSDDYYPYYHGTRVASALGSQSGNSYAVAGALGYTRSPIRVYKTLNSAGSGESIDTMVALMDAADDGVKVANVSLGEPATASGSFTPDPLLRATWQEVVDYCASQGMLVVAAAGNGADPGTSNPYYPPVWYPAACEGALAVGSINPDNGERSVFSSFGSELDVVAPGEQVQVAGPTGTTYSVCGTSFASPLVAGALGMLWSLVPDLDPSDVAAIATSTADATYGAPGFDEETGWGRFDAWSAYSAMTSVLPTQAPVVVSTTDPVGLETTLTWTPASGTNVRYRYGAIGGREYATTETTGRVLLPAGGSQTVWVRAYADDRFDAPAATAEVNADAGLSPLDAERLQGIDRYVTAAAISQQGFAGPVNALVIASGQNWPDGLSASVLAKTGAGPLLLTRQNALPTVTRDEVLRLAPSRIFIIGGTTAVSSAVENTLKSLQYTRAVVIERIGGVDRYETAGKVANRVVSLRGGAPATTVVIASGRNYPDALSAAPLAASAGWPILLSAPDGLPAATELALDNLGSSRSVVVGGINAISDPVLDVLPLPTRVSGATRYATSRAIAEWGLAQHVLAPGHVGFATGLSFPDALAAGPRLAVDDAGLLLTDPSDSDIYPWLAARSSAITAIDLYGGPAAVSYDTEMSLGRALR